MKYLYRIAVLFAFLAFLPSANAIGVTGTWKGSVDVQGEDVQVTFHLITAGNTVTGTVERTSSAPAEIHDGKIDGDSLSFWMNEDYQGQTYKVICKGKISAEKIEIVVGTDDARWSSELTATKSVDAASESKTVSTAGKWQGDFNFKGDAVSLTFHLTVAGNAVTGTVDGLPSTPANVHDGKVDGDSITFWVNTDYDGQSYKLVYKGKISGREIKFAFGTDDGSWSTEMTATKNI